MFSWLSSRARSTYDDTLEQVALTELNDLLAFLADMFPAHEVSLLRKLLLEASHESRLHMAANTLLEHPQRYAGRETRSVHGRLAEWEQFPSTNYRKMVEMTAEYRNLTQSAVRATLAENNYDYVRSRDALADRASRSWWFTLATQVSRRKPSTHVDVTKLSTGCPRLDNEIHALGRPARDAQSAHDAQVARALNHEEYAAAHALFQCECCFGDYAWEEIATCTNGHFFCRACLDRSIKEALYGQGGSLYASKASVRCISAASIPACDGFVAPAMLAYMVPPDTLERMEQRFAREQLQKAGLQLVHCPACSYAVASITPQFRLRLRLSAEAARLCLSLFLQDPLGMLITAFWLVLYYIHSTLTPETNKNHTHLIAAVAEVRRRKMSRCQLFKCENPHCGMTSCKDCGRAWTAFHDCRYEESERLHVERAMSEAVKRTCPRCNTSFVKTHGCNKLTCVCGYKMCYVCRANVCSDGYTHFCQHFRAIPGVGCMLCEKCNLYETENDQAVAAAAARRAAEEWVENRHDRAIGTAKNTQKRPTAASNNTEQLQRLIDLLFEW